MRFSRTVKTTDPDGRLLRLINVFQVSFQDVLHAFFILAVANKGFELIAQYRQGLNSHIVIDIGNTFIDQFLKGRVFQIDVSVFHLHPLV